MIARDGRVVVVGGGLASARTISALRRKGLTGPIDVISGEPHLPYDRPPLSKDVLTGSRDDTALPFDIAKLDVTVHRNRRAVGLDTASRTVRTDAGDIAYDGLVIATGASPIRMPGDGDQLTLRTIDDALTLRRRLVPGHHLVIIGASWIGAEVATVARDNGCAVTCLESAEVPLAGAIGDDAARHLLPWWKGIDLRCGVTVGSVTPNGVLLADGSTVPADSVVTGVGVRPAVGWLDDSGLSVDRGVLTDASCRTDAPNVVALGDVAQRWSPSAGKHTLVEHWDDAGGAAAAAAAALLSDDPPVLDPVPYFWSDQFGHKIQYTGAHSSTDAVAVYSDHDGALAAVTWTAADGTLTAWLGIDRPRDVVPARTSVGGPVTESPVVEALQKTHRVVHDYEGARR
ncbi:NAD(P)/FAD-dependent oxidoreductase [Gordonia zhaorongruii]|uniref:NAD(P)/FAD-dependent oxidoreductase n=1 Tax=Gordonia zhaorongruii TaxID=2597659 RepID=UPI001F3F9BEC|nr:FAD-dependent oxidoreductase [Gordonia zhaorongruii]